LRAHEVICREKVEASDCLSKLLISTVELEAFGRAICPDSVGLPDSRNLKRRKILLGKLQLLAQCF